MPQRAVDLEKEHYKCWDHVKRSLHWEGLCPSSIERDRNLQMEGGRFRERVYKSTIAAALSEVAKIAHAWYLILQ